MSGEDVSDIHSADDMVVAKIDALQAEYSAFETLHESDGLIDAAKELGVAYVAYSPLGHGWLVDNFDFKSPDDFAPKDFRRSGEPVPTALILESNTNAHSASPQISRRKLLQEQSHRGRS